MNNHSVRFDASQNILYDFKQLELTCSIDEVGYEVTSVLDFVDLDLSGQVSLDPSFQEPMYDLSLQGMDSHAMLYVPIDRFQNIFLCNIRKGELLEENIDHLRFAVDSTQWSNHAYHISFHNAIVDASFALNPKCRLIKQNIQNDFVRSIYFDMTGSLKFNAIFHNTTSLLENMRTLDTPIQNTFTNLLTTIGGTTSSPLTINDTSNNPSRDFLLGMFQLENKTYRKEKMLDELSSQVNTYMNVGLLQRYFILGTSYKGYGYYYPVYINKNHPDLYIGCKRITFPQYADQFFYVNPISLNLNLNDDNYPTYCKDYSQTIYNHFINIPFIYGDGIQSKITYKSKTNPYLNRVIHPRSYKVTFVMTLESEVNVDFTDLSFQTQSQIEDGTNEHAMVVSSDSSIDISGRYSFELLWLGSYDRQDVFFSHYHYYPYLEKIEDICMNLHIPLGGVPPCIEIYCRPRAYQTQNQVKVDKVTFYIPTEKIVSDTWQTFHVSDFKLKLNDYETNRTLKEFNALRINQTTTFTPKIHYRGSQQILQINLTSETNQPLQCKMKTSSIHMNDDHILFLKTV